MKWRNKKEVEKIYKRLISIYPILSYSFIEDICLRLFSCTLEIDQKLLISTSQFDFLTVDSFRPNNWKPKYLQYIGESVDIFKFVRQVDVCGERIDYFISFRTDDIKVNYCIGRVCGKKLLFLFQIIANETDIANPFMNNPWSSLKVGYVKI